MQGLLFAVCCILLLPISYTGGLQISNLLKTHGKVRKGYDPDIDRNVTELIRSKGYPVEEHRVQTEDGFLLSLQRIPHGLKENERADKEVVFLQHGLLASSDCFVLDSANQSLGFILADAGYDVWLGNTRGNVYSKRHAKYSSHSRKFWDFSFDEMARYDLPASIDYVLNFTGQDKLTYIGHSQGTTSALAMLSTNEMYNDKIKLFIALAPVANVSHITSAIKHLAPFANDINTLFLLLGIKELRPQNQLMKYLIEKTCDHPDSAICKDITYLFLGNDQTLVNKSRIAVYTAHFPAGGSSKSYIHYAQMVNSEKFQKFDYGRTKNMARYGVKHPPVYNVSRITTPVALLWAANDKLADPVDVAQLKEQLTNVVSYYQVPFALFSHVDFVLAMNAPELVYGHILELLEKYAK